MLARNEFAFLHDGCKLFSKGGSLLDLVSQQIASGQMDEIILLY